MIRSMLQLTPNPRILQSWGQSVLNWEGPLVVVPALGPNARLSINRSQTHKDDG